MSNPIVKAAAGKFGKGIQSLAVEQSVAKTPEIPLDLIIIKKQVRDEFEDEENPLSEMADDMKELGILQSILVRPVQGGKYELIAGERRIRAAKIAGLKTIPALVRTLTDEQVERAQFIENIKRKNLTLNEQAKRIQRDLDAYGGDVEAVLKKYGKPKSGRVWIYKMRGLLNLSEQAQRLISENITADMEVINDVRQIEKVNPAKAKETVDALKAVSTAKKTSGQEDTKGGNNTAAKPAKTGSMREISRNAKAEIATTKRQASKKDDEHVKEDQATPRDRDAEVPGQAFTISPDTWAVRLDNEARDDVLQVDEEEGRAALEEMLRRFFDKGANTVEWVSAVSEGIRQRDYDDSSMGRLKLAAFSAGFAKSGNFNLDVLIDKAKNL